MEEHLRQASSYRPLPGVMQIQPFRLSRQEQIQANYFVKPWAEPNFFELCRGEE